MTVDSAAGRDTSGADPSGDYDVAIVGCGPVGALLAVLLGQQQHRVLVVDRHERLYPRPRAVVFDDEIARVFAAAGVAQPMAARSEPATEYEWRNAAGQTLLHFDWSGAGPSGWPAASMFHQPDLEAVLEERLGQLPTVTTRRGHEAVAVQVEASRVELCTRGVAGVDHQAAATYVVGCDGANSFVRARMDTTVTDLGFFYDWLIVDVVLADRREFTPSNLQICDPTRPTTLVSGGPGRRRWEFMRLPGESLEDLNQVETAWRLLRPFGVTPDSAEIERQTVYRFQARWVDRWRDGRLLLAGDAAHLMPPFAGQGMCSGLRDAANLAWKLDLVLTGRVDDQLLDTYTVERSGHVQHAVRTSVALGEVICATDPQDVRRRDQAMIAAGADPVAVLGHVPPPALPAGLMQYGRDGAPMPGAGVLVPQGRVSVTGHTDRFDAIIGNGFALVCTVDPYAALSGDDLAFLDSLGTHLVEVAAADAEPAPDRPGTKKGPALDVDGVYLAYLAGAGACAALVRPDFYLFGLAADAQSLPALIAELRRQLATDPADTATPQRIPASGRGPAPTPVPGGGPMSVSDAGRSHRRVPAGRTPTPAEPNLLPREVRR